MSNGNGPNWVAVIGACVAGIIAIVQAFHGSAISDLKTGTMHKDTVQAHVENFDSWMTDHDRRLELLEKEQWEILEDEK